MRLVLLLLLPCFVFCTTSCTRLEEQLTYTNTFAVYSEQSDTIEILNCDGLGGAQPSGITVPSSKSPSSICRFPRQRKLPDEFTIRWRNMRTEEEFQQEMTFPRLPQGGLGRIKCLLDKENVWEWTYDPDHQG